MIGLSGVILATAVLLIFSTDSVGGQYGRERVRVPNRGSQPLKPQSCEQGSCYPATGNLLIGRENKLSASSTCGTKGPERFCIVSHLKERKKCFFCDGSLPKQHHRVENIVRKYIPGTYQESWWQSENGVENVTLQLDLEAEFHFTHIIIKFQTFRPAAMLIERSYDFGATWQVYRYFAHNCALSFPGVPTVAPRTLTDVVCESRYSNVAPSTDGEIIFRVLPPNVQIDNPYSKEVQNLLKMTNLRINFTRLHTLGDDLLDNRAEIREKYYYAIKDMVVRGSCSCYGHASRCLPLHGVANQQDMVHGRCECTHNTKGLNCEYCEDFYNDLPWKPAVGKQSNACKKCSCNNHATSCHFDQAVYERSGRVSGGVCDDCIHNTRGQNCEQCKPFYYHDSSRDITDPDACQPCDCDPAGSLDDGICDSRTDILSGDESGRCHCKANVDGRRCDRCKNGFWKFDPNNPEGCQACSCDTLGTIGNQGCNMVTGECICKRYVTGRDCNQCLPEYWGLSADRDGCKPCACDLGGAYDDSCDVVTGQCRCRAHVGGRTCNEPEQSHYTGAIDFLIYEGEHTRANGSSQIVIREPYRENRTTSWTGTGFMRAFEGSVVTFTVDDILKSMEYDIVVRYEQEPPQDWKNAEILIVREEPIDLDGPCGAWHPDHDRLYVEFPPTALSAVARPPVCLEAGKRYEVHLEFRTSSGRETTPSASILIDSIVLVPRLENIPFFHGSTPAEMRRQEYERYHCNEVFHNVDKTGSNAIDICTKYHNSIGIYVFDGAHSCECNPTGSHSLLCDPYGGSCPCKNNVVGRRCDRCAPGTYGFGPEGCVACDCDSVGAEDNFCDVKTGRCKCRPNTYGRNCGQCEPGFWNFPRCQRCECHGHADTCDSDTGRCHECRDFTTGHNCDRCAETFYGDPRINVDIPCRACPCPGTIDSGHSYADTCSLDPLTEDVICECRPGYAGPRCDVCAENYFGNPDVANGSCVPCDCSNNTDLSKPGNCNPHTGRCLACLYNTFGSNCQICKPGFWGDALKQDCKECGCDMLGSDRNIVVCDHRTGQCPCLPHVVGQQCDRCEDNHWRIASGNGCDPCSCDAVGSISDKCNEFYGTCECRSGFGGRQCNQCETNYWGNPNVECRPCECDLDGSSTQQCDRETGNCICHEGIGGVRCDHCDRGYVGFAPSCSPCGECFDNWDLILQGLGNQTQTVIDSASRIQRVGTTGVYGQEFENMEASLKQVEELVSKTSVRNEDLDELTEVANDLADTVQLSGAVLDNLDNYQETVGELVSLGVVELKKMQERTAGLADSASNLREAAKTLREADVYLALNATHQMAEQSLQAERLANGSSSILADAARLLTNTDNLVAKTSAGFTDVLNSNDDSLRALDEQLSRLEEVMPELNQIACGKSVSGCDDICGGAGCGSCGGLSCDAGAVSKVNFALDIAKQQSSSIKKQRDAAEQLLRNMTRMKEDSSAAKIAAREGFDAAASAHQSSYNTWQNASSMNEKILSYLEEEQSTPWMIRDLATKVLSKNIQLKPEEIQNLTDSINNMVVSLTDSEEILQETAMDLAVAEELRAIAMEAKSYAESTENVADKVVSLLADAEEATENARAAVEKAEQDVSLSEQDLEDIAMELELAEEKATNQTREIDDLDARIKDLQTDYAKNDFILTQEINFEILKAASQAEDVEANSEQLGLEFERVSEALANREADNKDSISRAKLLLKRASELAADTTTKFKDIHGMEDVYRGNERTLDGLSAEVDSLTSEMEKHLMDIEIKSQTYRECTT